MDERYHIEGSSTGDHIIEVNHGRFKHKEDHYLLIGGIDMSVFSFGEIEADNDGPFRFQGSTVLVPKGDNPGQRYWRFKEVAHQRVHAGDSLVAEKLGIHGQPYDTVVLSGKVTKIEELAGLEARLKSPTPAPQTT